MTDPIFIIGTERSGSNLLRLILTAHSQIVIPHPPHFMNYFRQLDYGDSPWESKKIKLLKDMLRLVEHHIFPWDEYSLKQEEILKLVRGESLFSIVAAIYESIRIQSGKSTWGCKSTFMVHCIPDILEIYPNARFLFLVRDPRDVSVSARTSVFSPCHPYLSGKLWAQQQEIGLKEMRKHPQQFFLIQYENLLQESQKTLENLCEFLQVPWEAGLLEFFQQKEAQKSSSLSESWRKTNRAIQSKNVNKYLANLTEREICLVESSCHELMQHFNYVPQNATRPPLPSRIECRQIALQERLLRLQVEWKSFRQDSNVFLRWRRDSYVRYLAFRYGE